MTEIGSEFWSIESANNEVSFFLSGRTALEFVICDVLAEHEIKSVYMPSYCCHTMIEPFIRHHIPIRFYDIYHHNGTLQASFPDVGPDEIFFSMSYFGYTFQNTGVLSEIKKNGCTVIEDTTHSWLISDAAAKRGDYPADYMFASYRKWTGFTGIASASKTNSRFVIRPTDIYNEKYNTLRKLARTGKYEFICNQNGDKTEYLSLFNDAEQLLQEDYVAYRPSYESLLGLINLDKDLIRTVRYENAKILMEGLSDIKKITPMFSVLNENDVPLCVPILVDPDIRDDLRKYLVSQDIYCPIHWPLSDLHDSISDRAKEIYSMELSLVCDQRYKKEDMKRILRCVRKFCEGEI